MDAVTDLKRFYSEAHTIIGLVGTGKVFAGVASANIVKA